MHRVSNIASLGCQAWHRMTKHDAFRVLLLSIQAQPSHTPSPQSSQGRAVSSGCWTTAGPSYAKLLTSRHKHLPVGDKWPERGGETADWLGPDILFVGFQEVNPLNALSVVAGAGLENIEAWDTCIDCALNCKAMPEGYNAAQVRHFHCIYSSRVKHVLKRISCSLSDCSVACMRFRLPWNQREDLDPGTAG